MIELSALDLSIVGVIFTLVARFLKSGFKRLGRVIKNMFGDRRASNFLLPYFGITTTSDLKRISQNFGRGRG
jgi:hypothetical protein